MVLYTKRKFEAISGRLRQYDNGSLMSSSWQKLAIVFCFLFGLAIIANTLTAADGIWYWYPWYFQHGKRLYADMHLAMQPLFVLEAEFFLALFGQSWIASKIPAVLNLLAFCVA